MVRVRVNLTGWTYTADPGTDERTLRIRFGDVATPARRNFYAFQTSSKASGGTFRRLATQTADPDDATPNVYTDIVRVGNARAGTGTITVTKLGTNDALSSVFVGDAASIAFTYTAAGAMHDYQTDDVAGNPASGINVYTGVGDDDLTRIAITLPGAFTLTDDNVRVSAKSSGVVLGTAGIDVNDPTITISIKRMEKDQSITIAYVYDAATAPTAAAAVDFRVTTQTTNAVPAVPVDTFANLDMKLQIKLKDGSGTMKIDDVSVKQGFEDNTFELTYTAVTEIRTEDMTVLLLPI